MMVSDEEKRWLVVGIVMNKVAAPVLRDFIKQGMDSHYANNTYCHGVTTPCALNTLTYHQVNADSNLKRLKFQNINNNHNNHGNHKSLYNYNVNSSVDLAKLFLPDFLAEFSGFDESLDMSAILRLLGYNNPAPIFLSPNPMMSIQLAADDVRKNVRNKWGHCNVTDWTEVLFNDCFSMLETLVRSLGLTGALEKTTLDQLSDWQSKGCQLCMGHAVDKHLLSLVQREVKGIIADVAGHETRLDAVETKLEKEEEARREEIDKILERLVSMKKMLSEELLRRVEGVEHRVEGVEHIVEGVEKGLAAANIKVEGLGQSMAQLQGSLTKTDGKVEQLAYEIKSQTQRIQDVKPVTDSEASAEDIFDVKFCRSKLAEHYKKTATVPTSVWSKNCLVDIHQIYTRLSWVKQEQTPAGSSRSELKHYTDVFTANKNGVVPKRILVQGQTGIGKSTFVKKLAVDWAELDDTTTDNKQKDILKTFELLVVVNLKEVSKCQGLKDVISRSSIFAREEKYLTDSLLNYITNNQDKVLLVFDGYDEYRCGRNSEIYEIFSGNELRNCCVLITTRISKADELRAFKDLHAEITGFGEEDRKTFMSRMLGGEAEANKLSLHLHRQNVDDLAKVPLLLLFFCTLWKKGKSESFPKSKTKLYLAIVQYVLNHNQRKDSPARFSKVQDFKEVLAEIGKVALECLLRDDHVFEYDQLSDAGLCDESFIVGLLQVTEYAENLQPAGMVSFIHKSIQEFLAAWFVTYRCVPEGKLGGIEQHTSTLEDCEAWENVIEFVCGLSDDGTVKVFQHLTSVRISDPTLDLSKRIPNVENEADVALPDVTGRHERFIHLVNGSFKEVQSKAALVRHWLDCTAGIILFDPERPFPTDIPKMTFANEVASCKVLWIYCKFKMSSVEDFNDYLHVLLRMTENSAAQLIAGFLRPFRDNTLLCIFCCFNFVLCFHNGKAHFYITELKLCCDDHARLFTETITISTPSCSANLCSKQSCLKFLRSLRCTSMNRARNLRELGAVIRNCKHLKTIKLVSCWDGVCELLDQVRNPSTCSLNFQGPDHIFLFWGVAPRRCSLKVEAEKLAGVLPRFNVTALEFELGTCCAAEVNRLCSIAHQTLKKLTLRKRQSHREISPLVVLMREHGSILQAEEMEVLFGGINKTFPSLRELSLCSFNATRSLASLTKRFQFFPSLCSLSLWGLYMDEHDLRGVLESLTSCPNLKFLCLSINPLVSKGKNPLVSKDRIESIVKQALPQVDLHLFSVTPGSSTRASCI